MIDPIVDADSAPFWNGVSVGQLQLQRCRSCRRAVFYPRALCPYCHSSQLAWFTATGHGTIYSFTVTRRASGALAAQIPFTTVLVDLDDGVRMLSRLVGDAPARIGARVKAVIQALGTETRPLPCFELVDDK